MILQGAIGKAAVLGRRVMHPLSTLVFVRALTLVVLVKVLLTWRIQAAIMQVHHLSIPHGRISGPLLFAARFAAAHYHIFATVVVGFLILHLCIRRNYWTAIIFCLLTFNLLIITIPGGNGGDVLAFFCSLWAIFLVPPDAGSRLATLRIILYNTARIMCMLQFIFMYVASGTDKLKSYVWSAGRAFDYMRDVEGIINPDFPSWLSTRFWDLTLSWFAIALEILFGVLIWTRAFQPALIMMAIVFHLAIWWMMDLAGFSLIMIAAVLIFVRDDQYLQMFKPQLLSK